MRAQLRDDNFRRILWGGSTHISGIEREESPSVMSDEQFKGQLTLFARCVKEKRAGGLLWK
jgi:hypothetical protein